MRQLKRSIAAAGLLASAALAGTGAAQAAAVDLDRSGDRQVTRQANPGMQFAQRIDRRRRRGGVRAVVPGPRFRAARRKGRRNRGIGAGGAAAIIGGAIITGIILSESAKARRRERYRRDEIRYDDDDVQDCADRYRSFRFEDGTYQPYGGGPRELCPYLE